MSKKTKGTMKTETEKEVFVYVRVSTGQQEEDGTSLETQIERCIEFAAKFGDVIHPENIFREVWTGRETDTRPVLQQLRLKIASGRGRVLYIYDMDRLSRDGVHMVMLKREVEAAGVELRCVMGTPTEGKWGELVTFVQGFSAGIEAEQFIERTMRGKEKVARDEQRLPCGTGSGLYGYDYRPGDPARTINETEATIVQQIFQEAADGTSRHIIAKRLNEASIPTKRGKKWYPLGVERVLRNQAYTGVQNYGEHRYRKVEGRREVTDRPESEWTRIEGFTPALVTQAQFDLVQERLAVSQCKADKRIKKRYLLTGLAYCLKCGTGLSGTSFQRNRLRYYRCRATWSAAHRPQTCDARYISADDLESLVWSELTRNIKHPAVMSADMLSGIRTGEDTQGPRRTELRREIDKLKKEQGRLLGLFGKEDIDEDLLMSQLGPLKMRCDQKEKSLRVLEEQRQQLDDADEVERRITQHCDRLAETLDDLDFEGQRATLMAMGTRIEVGRQEIGIDVEVNADSTAIARTSA